MAKKSEKQSKDVKKLRKAVEELGEQNEKLAKTVEKLRRSQEKSREEVENIVRDLESKIEASSDEGSTAHTAVTVGADGAIVSGEQTEEPPEEDSNAPNTSADDEVGGEPLEEASDAPTVSADDGISSGSSDEPKATVKATESAKRKAGELGVDPASIEGTGSRGRITVEDVEKAAEKG